MNIIINYTNDIYTIFLKMFLALLLGGLIGYERSIKRHSAGLRTFILVTLSSTMAALIDSYVSSYSTEFKLSISSALVIGLSFICTYTIIISSKCKIKGLTTSFALFSCSILGITIGIGYYLVALIGFLILFLSLYALPRFELYLKDNSNHFDIHLELKNVKKLKDFVIVLRELGIIIDDIEHNPAYANSGLFVYTISLSIYNKTLKQYKKHSQIIEALSSLEYVNYIEEIK